MTLNSPTEEMRDWVEGLIGSPIAGTTREFAGGSRPLWYLQIGDESYVLRLDTGGGALAGSIYDVKREIDVYRALAGSVVPVPNVLGTRQFTEGLVMLMSRAPGDSRLPRDTDGALVLIDDLVKAIADLHSLDAAHLDLGWGQPPSIHDSIRHELAVWNELASAHPRSECSYALGWLGTHLGSLEVSSAPAVLVQGDTGPGNAVFDGKQLSAIVDWELSHFGDPMEDLAWIDQRCQQWDLIAGARARRLRAYGLTVNEQRIAYHAVFVRLRCAVITARTIKSGGGALGLAVYEPAQNRFNREIVRTICEASGITTPDPDRITSEIAREIGFDPVALRAQVESIMSNRPVDKAQRLTHRENAIRELHQWMESNHGVAMREHDAADAMKTLGAPPDPALLRAAGASTDEGVLAYLARSSIRTAMMWPEPTLG